MILPSAVSTNVIIYSGLRARTEVGATSAHIVEQYALLAIHWIL